ncbi:hypothetical protein Vi05172_g3811 [Venturia inaequalis]|nr:hypothetical protein Vi05172_g3811 [Venturia inaequalis]
MSSTQKKKQASTFFSLPLELRQKILLLTYVPYARECDRKPTGGNLRIQFRWQDNLQGRSASLSTMPDNA